MLSVIVLNAKGEFWCRVGVERAIVWKYQNKVHVIEEHPTREYHSVSLTIRVPLIVQLMKFVGYRPKREDIPYSVNGVYERDKNVCQYWHYEYINDENGDTIENEDGTLKRNRFKHQCTIDDRTIDHVLPVSRNGKSTFENTICCCRACNELRKKNKTPQEAGLHLWRRPISPTRDVTQFVIRIPVFNPRNLADKIYREKGFGDYLTKGVR